MTLNELENWLDSNLETAMEWYITEIEAAIDWIINGYDNLFGAGDIGELTIGQALFVFVIACVILTYLLKTLKYLVGFIRSKKRSSSDKDSRRRSSVGKGSRKRYSANEDPWNT
jgi:hypothetical protein